MDLSEHAQHVVALQHTASRLRALDVRLSSSPRSASSSFVVSPASPTSPQAAALLRRTASSASAASATSAASSGSESGAARVLRELRVTVARQADALAERDAEIATLTLELALLKRTPPDEAGAALREENARLRDAVDVRDALIAQMADKMREMRASLAERR